MSWYAYDMPFQKGHKLAIGRPKGSKNRFPTAIETLEKHGFNPILKLIQLYDEAETLPNRTDGIDIQQKIATNIGKFVFAQPKSVVHEGNVQINTVSEIIQTRRVFTTLIENPKAFAAMKLLEAELAKDAESDTIEVSTHEPIDDKPPANKA